MKITLKSISIFVFLLLPALTHAAANTYYVTQSGSGDPMSISEFNALGGTGYAGDTFYFSGTFTTRITVNISGTSGNPVTLDGYQTGDCDPLNSVCTSSALLYQGMHIYARDYVTIQDFRITMTGSASTAAVAGTNTGIDYFIFKRNYVYDTAASGFYFGFWDDTPMSQYIIIEGNKFVDQQMRSTSGESQAVSLIRVQHVLMRNNIIGHDNPNTPVCPGGCNTMTIHGSNDILFENNEVYGAPHQTGLAVKELSGHTQNRHIYRFNKFYNNLGGSGVGISFGTESGSGTNYMYLYGNFIFNNYSFGVMPHRDFSYIYIWSNIISDNGQSGVTVWGDEGSGDHVSFINNTFARNGTGSDPDPNQLNRGAISTYWGSSHVIKNNLFFNNRLFGALGLYHQIYDTTSVALEHNTFFHSSATATWYYADANRSLTDMQEIFDREDDPHAGEIDDPGFTDPDGADNTYGTEDDDYTLTGNTITDGKDLSQCFTQAVDLSGGDAWMETNSGYGRYIEPCLDDALDPNATDWTTTPPTVATVKRDTYGWERGAYAYVGLGKPRAQAPAPPDPVWIVE